jgi:cytochrome P450
MRRAQTRCTCCPYLRKLDVEPCCRSFALLNLAHNPRVQEKLRAELLACPQLAPDAAADECTFQVLASLPYLDAVTNEMCGRLH